MRSTLICLAGLAVLTACNDPTKPDPSRGLSDPAPIVPGARAAPMNEVIQPEDIGNLGGSFALAIGLNEHTQVVGLSTTPAEGFQFHPYLWVRGGGMRDLGTLGGDNGIAFEVNDRTEVVGFSDLAGGAGTHAYLWTGRRGMQDLGTLGGTNSGAEGINNRGFVVGDAQTAAGRALPFIWKPGRGMRSLEIGTLGGSESEGSAKSINEASEVAGFVALQGFDDPASPIRAFRWTPQGGMQDLGTLGGDLSLAWGINEEGDVVGQSSDATGASQAFLWTQRRGMQGLGTLGGDYASAFNVNVRRVVVGESHDATGRLLPFVWIDGLGMRALPIEDVGGVGGAAVGINEKNEIAGLAFTADGGARAVLWRPRGDLMTASIAETSGDFEVSAAGEPQKIGVGGCAQGRRYGARVRTAADLGCQFR